jgi:hypothetical protein
LNQDTLDYLSFVHGAEPLVDYDNQYGRAENSTLASQYKQALQTAEYGIAQAKAPFLKLRYLFSAMRLAHYSKQYTEEARLYKQYAASLQKEKVDSEVWQWIYALKAGMDKQQGKRVEAAYQFAKLFATSKTKRYSAYVDFSIKSDQEWQALMDLCKDNDEKALMHFLRALTPKANSLQELQQIYALAPNSVWLDALLSRELEYVQFAKQETNSRSQYSTSIADINKTMLIDDVERYGTADLKKLKKQLNTRRSEYINNFSKIVDKIRSEDKHKDLFFADFSHVYLQLLMQQPITLADVGQLQTRYANDPRSAYIEPLKLFVYLEKIPTVNDKVESEISIYLQNIQKQSQNGVNFRDILAYTYIKLSPLYAQQKAAFKHYIAIQRGEFDPDTLRVFEIRDLQALSNKGNKNFLEQQMLASTNIFLSEGHNVDEIIAKKYLSAGLFAQASKALQQAPEKVENKYNLFNNSLSGNNRNGRSTESTKTLAKKLAQLSAEIKVNPSDANAHYLLGNASYNMTWFGNSPMLSRYHRSSYTWKRGEINLDKAKQYYQSALEQSKDKELQAKILYGLSKIEFAEKYMQADQKGNGFNQYSFEKLERKASINKLKSEDFGQYFSKLYQYKDTQYYRDVIQQCNIYNSRSW